MYVFDTRIYVCIAYIDIGGIRYLHVYIYGKNRVYGLCHLPVGPYLHTHLQGGPTLALKKMEIKI